MANGYDAEVDSWLPSDAARNEALAEIHPAEVDFPIPGMEQRPSVEDIVQQAGTEAAENVGDYRTPFTTNAAHDAARRTATLLRQHGYLGSEVGGSEALDG